jgi:RecB family exonuclease
VRELERVQAALARFQHRHHPKPPRVNGVESQLHPLHDHPRGEHVQLTGYADRIELDADGNVVVVDLKTGRTKPSNKAVEAHVQLGLYQYAVDHGAIDDLAPDARAGGAELVQLGMLDGGPEAIVQPQPVQPEDGPDRALLRDRLRHTASLLRAEEFPAVAGQHCRDCSFVPICPIKGAGSVTSQ